MRTFNLWLLILTAGCGAAEQERLTGASSRIDPPGALPFMEFGQAIDAHDRSIVVGAPVAKRAYLYAGAPGENGPSATLSLDDVERFGEGVALDGGTIAVVGELDRPAAATVVATFDAAGGREQTGMLSLEGAWGRGLSLSHGTLAVSVRADEGRLVEIFRDGEPAGTLRSDDEGDGFGMAVAVGADFVAVGAPAGRDGGHVDVFVERSGAWRMESRLTASDGRKSDRFGASLDTDGTQLIVGAPHAAIDGGGVPRETLSHTFGAAYVFTRTDGAWSETGRLRAPDAGRDAQLGAAVAVRGDVAVAGMPGQNGAGGPDSGGGALFRRTDRGWAYERALLDAGAPMGSRLGTSAALMGDTAIFGAPGGTAGPGAIHAFRIP